MKLNCLIIDDEPIARKVIEEFVEDVEYLELAGSVDNPIKAMQWLNTMPIDIIFLDINMPKMNGFEFIRSSTNLPEIIVTTAYTEYAVEGFQLNVLDYLVKPISFERFIQAVNKAKMKLSVTNSDHSKNKDDFFFIKNNSTLQKIYHQDLLYVEGLMNYVVLHTTTEKLIVYFTIKSMLEQLPSDMFIKVHKSFIINLEKIKSIEGNIINIGNAKITISQNLREEVLHKVLKDKLIKR